MGMSQKWESSLSKAKHDTLSAFGTVRFWLFESFLVAFITIFVILWQPSWAKEGSAMTYYQVLSPVAGAILGLVIVFSISLFLAPYRQRNEARALLSAKPKPISISNRDELLRTIKQVQETAKTFIWKQEPLCQMQRTNITVNTDAKIEVDKAFANYKQAETSLEEEIVVAGEAFAPYISSFLELIKLHVCMRYYNWDNRPNWTETNTALDDGFRRVIKIIDVISGNKFLIREIPK